MHGTVSICTGGPLHLRISDNRFLNRALLPTSVLTGFYGIIETRSRKCHPSQNRELFSSHLRRGGGSGISISWEVTIMRCPDCDDVNRTEPDRREFLKAVTAGSIGLATTVALPGLHSSAAAMSKPASFGRSERLVAT